jgi:hypothetical protein
MIEKIRTEGFKGFDLDEDVPNKVIYTGPNMSGKSTRAGAIAIALYGNIPFSTAGKKPGDILDSFGSGDSIICAVKVGGKDFARKISRNAKGGASQVVQIDGKRVAAENFAIMLDRAGGPKMADVAEFMKVSETKKIDTLFDLYPNPELASIDSDIEKAKKEVSNLEKKKSGAESTIQRLTNSKHEEQIKQAEIEEAKVQAEEEGKRKEKERAKIEADQKMVVEKETGISIKTESFLPGNDSFDLTPPSSLMESELPAFPPPLNPFGSIQRIIKALKDAGCGTCAALIIAKQELKKYA